MPVDDIQNNDTPTPVKTEISTAEKAKTATNAEQNNAANLQNAAIASQQATVSHQQHEREAQESNVVTPTPKPADDDK